MPILHLKPPTIRRNCVGCGQSLQGHPAGHWLCRTCYGYSRLRQVLGQALADIRAIRP